MRETSVIVRNVGSGWFIALVLSNVMEEWMEVNHAGDTVDSLLTVLACAEWSSDGSANCVAPVNAVADMKCMI